MIFCTNKTVAFIHHKKKQWHQWFAWFPVTIEIHPNGSKTKVWLAFVQRKGKRMLGYGDGDWWEYEYKYWQGEE